eukprot:967667-Prymnesium_polylepis.1
MLEPASGPGAASAGARARRRLHVSERPFDCRLPSVFTTAATRREGSHSGLPVLLAVCRRHNGARAQRRG